ncbi:MAG: GerMN domain-containing protein [Ktedonobacteraceae bacterium]|nr:GerMN domain-containing protein [Ktedonobacteraceae bacterium]
MANQHKDVLVSPSRHPRFAKLIVASSFVLFVFLLSACNTNQVSATLAGAGVRSGVQTMHATTAQTYPIKVFFSKYLDVNTNLNAVAPVDRISPTVGVGTFAIQLLIAGPTTTERAAGYFSELNSLFTGSSTCANLYPVGGPDFTLTLNKKGNVTEAGTATLRFCRAISSPGIGADARVTAEINATLKQFSTIKKVVILTVNGSCFGDESGLNLCLR